MNSTISTIIITIITAVGTWFLSRTKSKAEVEKIKAETFQIQLESYDEAINLWKNIALDLRTEVANLTVKVELLTKENHELKEAYQNLAQTLKDKV